MRVSGFVTDCPSGECFSLLCISISIVFFDTYYYISILFSSFFLIPTINQRRMVRLLSHEQLNCRHYWAIRPLWTILILKPFTPGGVYMRQRTWWSTAQGGLWSVGHGSSQHWFTNVVNWTLGSSMKFDSNYAHFLFCEHLFENVTANFGHVNPRAIQTRQAALDWNVMLYTKWIQN